MPTTTKTVICEPAELLREALTHVLTNSCRCEVLGAFAKMQPAIEAANSGSTDVLVLDLTCISPRDQSRLLAGLRANCLDAGLLILADAGQATQLRQLMAVGADACMFTSEDVDVLDEAVQTIANGQRYRSPEVMRALDEGGRPAGIKLHGGAASIELTA